MAKDQSWIADLLSGYRSLQRSGVDAAVQRNVLNLVGFNLSLSDNPNNSSSDLQVTGVPALYNVKDPAYGAKGDGTTDDTNAIQAAINAAAAAAIVLISGAATVYFPPAQYVIKSTITVKPNVTLQGDARGGSILLIERGITRSSSTGRLSGMYDAFQVPLGAATTGSWVQTQNIAFRHLTFQGTNVATPGTALSGTVTVTAASSSVAFSQAQTLNAGDLLVFSTQPGVYYAVASATSNSLTATLTTAYNGPASTTATVARNAALSGTFGVTNGSTTVTTTTNFTGTALGALYFAGSPNDLYNVASFSWSGSAGTITLTRPFTGATAASTYCCDVDGFYITSLADQNEVHAVRIVEDAYNYSSDVTIEHCQFRNLFGYICRSDASGIGQRHHFKDNQCFQCAGEVNFCGSYSHITRNTFDTVWAVECAGSFCEITHNVMRNMLNAGVSIGGDGGQSTYVGDIPASLSGNPNITFSGDTITRAAGSWTSDGFMLGQNVTVSGTTSNNGTFGPITGLTSTVVTVASATFTAEGPKTGVTITKSSQLGDFGNIVAYNTIDGSQGVGIAIADAQVGTLIAHNYISQTATQGIQTGTAFNPPSQVVVDSNTITSCGGHGIWISTGSQLFITNNKVMINTQNGRSTGIGIILQNQDGSVVNATLTGNDVRGSVYEQDYLIDGVPNLICEGNRGYISFQTNYGTTTPEKPLRSPNIYRVSNLGSPDVFLGTSNSSTICSDTFAGVAIVCAHDKSTGIGHAYGGIAFIGGGDHAVTIMSDPASTLSNSPTGTQDGKIHIYWDSTSSTYMVRNEIVSTNVDASATLIGADA